MICPSLITSGAIISDLIAQERKKEEESKKKKRKSSVVSAFYFKSDYRRGSSRVLAREGWLYH